MIYLAEIGEHYHDDFRMSCWATNPRLIFTTKCEAENYDIAKQLFKNWCDKFNTENDNILFRIRDIKSLDDIISI